MADKFLDVLIVGAGPVGLFCANELSRQGLNCRLVDKKTTLSDKSKALALHIRTLDLIKDCGFLDEILLEGHQVDGIMFKSNGKELIHATFNALKVDRPYVIDLPQSKTEHILFQNLIKKGIQVEWETELTAVQQEHDFNLATLKHSDGRDEEVKASWIIACDGSHSTLRKLVKAEFVGSSYKQTWWLADVRIDWALPENKILLYVSEKGPAACFPMGDKRYRLVMTAPEKIMHQEPTMENIEQTFKARCSDNVLLSDPHWISQFGIDHKQIQNYRYGRIFFAGDSAHVHSPMGGQGMNTGLQDIYNLAWKLALVHKGLAKESLLDSYHKERHPIAAEVLKKTGIMTHMMMMSHSLLITIRNFILQTAMSFHSLKKYMLYDIAELSISYAKSPIVKILGKKTQFKVGEFLTNFTYVEIKNKETKELQDMTQGINHHLLLFAGLNNKNVFYLAELAAAINKQLRGLIQTHIILPHSEIIPLTEDIPLLVDENQKMHQHFKINQPTAVLIRPDKYIGLTQSPVNKEELLTYLQNSYFKTDDWVS